MSSLFRAPLVAAANAAVPFALKSHGSTFADSVLQLIGRVRQQSIEPTIDTSRYPDGFAPYGPFAALIVSRFVKRNFDAVNRTAALFADDGSRELLRQLLAYRAVGPYRLRLPTRPDFADDMAKALRTRVGDSDIPGLPSGLFAFDFRGADIRAECSLTSIVQGVFGHQYYFERDGVAIEVESGDTVIDAGGCYGDTALIMAASAGPEGRIYSFEPIPDQIHVFERNLARNPELAGRITIVPNAVGDKSGQTVAFARSGPGSRQTAGGDMKVETLAIDDLVERDGLAKVDYIKMDVEGAERRALEGAAGTVSSFRPKLGIAVYHSLSDLIYLPQFVKEIEPTYSLYLDHHTVFAEETILYALAG